MPVPRYERQVSPTALSDVRPQGQMPEFASALPEVARHSRELAKAAQVEKQRADEAATQAAWAKAAQARNRMVYDPQTGLAAKRGKDALGAEDTLLPQFDAEMDAIENELGNPSQREMFSQLRQRERVEFQGRIASHTFSEVQRMEDESFKSALGTAIDDGALNYRQPGKVAETKKRMKALIDARAQRQGWDAETVGKMQAEAVSQMHRGIFDRELANENVPAAEQAYLSAKRGKEATGADLTYMENRLKPAKAAHSDRIMLETVAGISDKYLMTYSDASVARADMEAEHGDKPYFKAALAEFNRKFKDREDMDQFALNDRAYEQVDAALAGKPLDPVAMSKLPAAVRKKITDYSSAVSKWGAEAVSASGDTFVFLQRKAHEDPGWFMRANLVEYGLEPALLKQMRNLQLGMRNKDEKAQAELDGIASRQDKVRFAAEGLGFRTPEKRLAFEMTVDKAVVEFERVNRRKIEPKEFTELVDNMKIQLKLDKSKLLQAK